MQLTEVVLCTPCYVLMDGNNRIGPKVAILHSGRVCTAIYGFSDKDHYDKFCLQSDLTLKPYPLVKGYLHNQVESAVEILKLVVVDAAGFDEPTLHAATMRAVLNAQENKMRHVNAVYRLDFDQQLNAYRVTNAVV